MDFFTVLPFYFFTFLLFYLFTFLLLVALKDAVNGLLRQFLREQTHNPYHWEATHHSDGTAVNGIDGVANEQIPMS